MHNFFFIFFFFFLGTLPCLMKRELCKSIFFSGKAHIFLKVLCLFRRKTEKYKIFKVYSYNR